MFPGRGHASRKEEVSAATRRRRWRAAMFHDRGWIRYEAGPQLNPETDKTPNYRDVPNDKSQLEARNARRSASVLVTGIRWR
jgi:hypothetical protein